MASTSIKVPVELRDRLAQVARRQHMTLAATIAHALDVADEAEFWADVRRTIPVNNADHAAGLDGTLPDGLGPDEDWSDLL